MLGERARVDRSHEAADSVLSQAYAVQEGFRVQRETLASINRRITLAASQVPGINTLIGRISAKKRRDGVIMGGFIAVCFFGVLVFLVRREGGGTTCISLFCVVFIRPFPWRHGVATGVYGVRGYASHDILVYIILGQPLREGRGGKIIMVVRRAELILI